MLRARKSTDMSGLVAHRCVPRDVLSCRWMAPHSELRGDADELDSGDRLLRERKSTDMEGETVTSFLQGGLEFSSSTTSHSDCRFLLVANTVERSAGC